MLLVDCISFIYNSILHVLLISVILKVRDENILKTGLGGDYLVNNYFTKVKDIGRKRRILKRESDPENAEWNELKVRGFILVVRGSNSIFSD